MTTKTCITVVVLGHVDHGKSTLIGRFLYENGQVTAEEIERYSALGAQKGKASFKYAWVMDKTDEARSRGLTLDLNYADLETRKRAIHIIDAPGHKNFVRSMITGTTGADAALLVVDAQEGVMPQTKEHAQLAKLMGVDRVIVAINKIDKVDYDPVAIGRCAKSVRALLDHLGATDTDVDVIPVSAWEGANLTVRGERMGWYDGRTLEAVLDTLPPRSVPLGGSFRLPVMQVLKISGVGTVVIGRVERGKVTEGDEVCIMPADKIGVVRSIEAYGKKITSAKAGDSVGIALRNISRSDASRGDALGTVDDPPNIIETFTAKIVLLGDAGVVKPGWSPYIHCHTAAVPVRLEAIEMKFSPESGEAVDEASAYYLMEGDAALVRIKPLKPLIIEPGEELPGMARFALRAGKVTLGAGTCMAVHACEREVKKPGTKDAGFSYKHQKAGRAAKEQKRRKEKERQDIWGQPVRKTKR